MKHHTKRPSAREIQTAKAAILESLFNDISKDIRDLWGDATDLDIGLIIAEAWGENSAERLHNAIIREVALMAVRGCVKLSTIELEDGTKAENHGTPAERAHMHSAIDALSDALRPKLADYWHAVSNPPDDAPDDIAWPDYALCELLRGIGDTGKDAAKQAEENARERYHDNPYRVFFDWSVPGLARYPKAVAKALWADQVKPHVDGAPPNYPRVYGTDTNDIYAGAHKVLSGVSWAIDGPGITVGGDQYGEAPGVRYWPRSLEVLPQGKRPHQQVLGAVLYDQPPVSLAVQTVQGASSVLGMNESKLALLFMLSGYAQCSTTLAELAKELMPGKARIQKRDYKAIVEAIRNMRRMTIALPDNNTDVQLFDIVAPLNADRADRDQHVSWRYNRSFEHLLDALQAQDNDLGRAGMFAGEFLINVSAFMRFNGNQGNYARQYLAACAMFNDSQSPYAPPTYTRESWASYANTLSPATTQLLLEGTGSRADQAAKARDLKAAERDLDALADMGLLTIDGSIKKDRFTIRPPEEWKEARRARRKHGARNDPDK